MYRILLVLAFVLGQVNWTKAQSDEVDYDKFFHTTLGGGYGVFGGEIGNHLKNTVAAGTSLGAGISKNSSINLNFHIDFTDTTDDPFTLDSMGIAKDRPEIFNVGLGYNRIFGDGAKSHFHGQVALGYSWLDYQNLGSKMQGIVPMLELGWALLIKSTPGRIQGSAVRYGRGGIRVFDVMTGSGQSHYRPVMNNKFIDFYLSCKYMNLNNPEGKGLMFFFGARYKKIVYSESYIPGEN